MPIARTHFLLLTLTLLAFPFSPIARADEPPKPLQDFEGKIQVNHWPDDGHAEVSTDWASDGKHSLHIAKGTLASIEEMSTHDWSAYQVWRFHCHVAGKDVVLLGIELADKGAGYLNRHQDSATAAPGDSIVEIDISGNLWRGEVNHPYRDLKTPIDKKHIERFAITASSTDVYIDQIELVKVTPLATSGGFAFQFGPPSGVAQRDWIAIHPASRWDEKAGYGLSGGAQAFREFTPYPTPVMGGGVTFNDAHFDVRLGGGKYIGWIIFERSGFWEDSQASYRHADFSANGKVVHSHDAEAAAAFFLLQDTEVLNEDQLVHQLILPVTKVADFSFTAIDGKNSFTLTADGVRPPRLAGLVLAPDTAEGRAFVEAHKKLQEETIRKVHRLTGAENRVGEASKATTPVIAIPLASDAVMRPGDWPAATASAPVPAMQTMAGLTASRVIGLYARDDVQATIAVAVFAGEGAAAGSSIPASAVRLQRNVYLPIRGYDETGCTIETHHYVPLEKSLVITPTVARELLLQIDVPAGAKPGKYTAMLSIDCVANGKQAAAQQMPRLQVPLTLQIHGGTLPGHEMPVGLFFSGVPVSPPIISDELYWKLAEAMLRQMQTGSLTILTGGPDFAVTWHGDTPVWSGDDAVKLIHMAKPYGLDMKVVEYGGLSLGIAKPLPPPHGNMSEDQTLAALFTAWHDFANKNALPEHYLYAYDEPTTPSDFEGVETRLTALRKAGFTTNGYTSAEDPAKADAQHVMLARLTSAPAFGEYTPATLKWVHGLGNEPWIYGGDLRRQSLGVDLWRAHRYGAAGRLCWIGSIVQGFQYDTLDGREPDPSCFYMHSKLGVLIALLGVAEGGIDRRLLFEMERRGAAGSAAAKAIVDEVEAKPFRKEMVWDEMEALRAKMLGVMDEGK